MTTASGEAKLAALLGRLVERADRIAAAAERIADVFEEQEQRELDGDAPKPNADSSRLGLRIKGSPDGGNE